MLLICFIFLEITAKKLQRESEVIQGGISLIERKVGPVFILEDALSVLKNYLLLCVIQDAQQKIVRLDA